MVLSIIIVSFNTKEVLSVSLKSLYGAYKDEFTAKKYEVLVLDNGSKDGSVEFLKKEHPHIYIVENKVNIGFGAANNIGVNKTTGKYVLFLNPDTVVPRNTLHLLVEYFDAHKDVGIVSPKVMLPDGIIDDACHRGFPTPWRALCHFSGLGRIFPKSQLFNGYHMGYRDLDTQHEIDACAGACLMIRREVGERAGWFDEDYFWYGEDLDLCFRVKMEGYKIMFLPEASIIHHKGAASGLKKHSQHLSKIDMKTKQKITQARFEVMRIFYRKHYVNKYPRWLTLLVFWGIDVIEKMQNATKVVMPNLFRHSHGILK